MAQLYIDFPRSAYEDDDDWKIEAARENIMPILNYALQTRQQTVRELEETAKEADTLYKQHG